MCLTVADNTPSLSYVAIILFNFNVESVRSYIYNIIYIYIYIYIYMYIYIYICIYIYTPLGIN